MPGKSLPPGVRSSAGWRPDRNGPDRPAGPYAHASVMDQGSLQAGAGLFSNTWSNGASLDLMSANVESGLMGDPGQRRIGTKANAQMFKGQTPADYWIGGDMDVFTAGIEGSVGEDGFTAGLGATAIGGALRLGNTNADSNQDRIGRFGLSAGVGAAARGHWGDADHDGHREYGFGADIGPVSFDYKTEDPLMDLMPGGSLIGSAASMMGYEDLNLTESVGGAVSSAWNWAFGD